MDKENKKIEQYLSSHLIFSLVGKLTSGIVHNLNGPLQILSMQIELFNRELKKEISELNNLKQEIDDEEQINIINNIIDKFHKRIERIEQLETTINRMENIVNIISKRCRTSENLNSTVLINQILEEELLFWQGDLFFKHHVEKNLELSTDPIFVQTDETKFRLLIDLLLAVLIDRIKEYEKPSIKIETLIKDNNIIIIMDQSGKKFNLKYIEYNNILDILRDIYKSNSMELSKDVEQIVLLYLTKYLCLSLNIDLEVGDNNLKIRINKKHSS